MDEKKKYEDFQDLIDLAVKKQKSRWRLDAIKWFDFEDVEQVVKSHIAQKWHMWDQTRPLEPWLSRVITNRMWNLIRNHYGSYIKPCSTCIHARDELCAKTKSGNQDVSCKDFAKWSKKKKYGLELKTAGSLDETDSIGNVRCNSHFDYDGHIDKLNQEMRNRLSEKHFTAYHMLYFEECSEEDIAIFMGYKITDATRKTGYRQVKNLKNKFQEMAISILKQEDPKK
jgi:DNA-directed RNA polymerase specialized sigma24 family protein|tara:strand:- start:2615 stop:3295 length:681 start_codon:yes stop_codon:yes gene_type:complete